MPANPIADHRSLTKVAAHVDTMLIDTIKKFADKARSQSGEIDRIKELSLMSEAEERQNALSATHSDLDAKKQHLQQIKKDAGLGGLMAPIQTWNKFRNVRQAEADYAAATQKFESPEEFQRRTALISQQNRYVVTERDRLADLRIDLEKSNTANALLTTFRKDAAEAVTAAQADGWVASLFPEGFRAMAQHLEAGRLTDATKSLSELKFQRKPSPQQYDEWCKEAASILETSYQGYKGFAASGAYAKIATDSMALAKPLLRPKHLEELNRFSHSADQWQKLAATLTDPRSMRIDVLWAIYWSMFQASQWVAHTLAEAEAREDVLTGKVIAQIDRWLSDWGSKHIQQFGYPTARSYMGTFDIAGTPEETRLGADLGMIIDIEIGGLVCKKVALFQAKKVMNGLVDIGSTSSQLPLLSARPRAGFYLFYHQASYPLHSPAPTVCSANHLAQYATEAGYEVDAKYIPTNVRSFGWDWANFLAFGLCNAQTELGEPFDSVDEAISILGNGDARHLPKHLCVVAITDEARVMELRGKVREHYHESIKSMEKKRQNEKSHLSKDRGHSMER